MPYSLSATGADLARRGPARDYRAGLGGHAARGRLDTEAEGVVKPFSAGAWQRRRLMTGCSVVVAFYGLLLIPDRAPPPLANPNRESFSWNQDARWDVLETRFKGARALGCARIAGPTDRALRRGESFVSIITAHQLGPAATVYDRIEENLFQLGTLVSACRERLPAYIRLVTATRAAVKRQSEFWDFNAPTTTDRLYRLLYGSRAALEEVM